MRFEVAERRLLETAADMLVVGVFEDGTEDPAASQVDDALGGAIRFARQERLFRARLGETLLLPTVGRLPAKAVVATGLGDRQRLGPDRVRRAASMAARQAQRHGARTLAVAPLGAESLEEEPAHAEATLLGSALGGYRYTAFRSGDEGPIERVLLATNWEGAGELVRQAEVIARAVATARDLVNLPPNHKLPEDLARRIADLGQAQGLAVRILWQADLQAMGAGGILAVGQGSDHPPAVVFLEWRGAACKPLGFLGKGLTFDSGGLSLKTAAGMETMKSDMAGAAAVVGAMLAIAELALPVDVIGCVVLAENMTGGNAQRPGDVLRMLSGKTVEMLNSDAEGRLVLADGVTLLQREGVQAIVDLATLTGACVTALGEIRAGLLGNDDAWQAKLEAAAARASERVWRMPADEEYRELLQSHIADLKNVGGRSAGMQTGGLFIGAFVEGVPWAHLDIAGTAFRSDDQPPLGFGGTGFGVETLIRLAMEHALAPRT